MYKPAIIIPAYRREKSLSRLLNSVNLAYYPVKDVHLIISLDYGATEEVKKTAANFDFDHGYVHVIEQPKKLGVKEHILKCGDFAVEYGSALVLEEDLFVSPGFYSFALNALDFYHNEESIAGISLYSQRFNESAQLPFEPLKTEDSAYFMKLVCSWGQAWTAKQWQGFKEWYSTVDSTTIEKTIHLPTNIKAWDDSSWKKYYDAYLINSGKFIVYPYYSFSTHCADEKGEHITKSGNLFHVPLRQGNPTGKTYKFPVLNHDSIKYDTHMECSGELINAMLDLGSDNIAVDLYGTKSIKQLQEGRYILTSKKLKNPLRSFPLEFKPIELNMKFESYSKVSPFFYLYKTENMKSLKFEEPNHLRFARYFAYQNFLSGRLLRSFFKNLFV